MDYFFSIQILINFILEVNKSSLCMHHLEVCCILSTIRTLTLVFWLLDACLSPWRLRFDPRPDYVGFVVTKVAKCHVFLQVLQFSSVNISPPVVHTHISFINRWCYIISAIDSMKWSIPGSLSLKAFFFLHNIRILYIQYNAPR